MNIDFDYSMAAELNGKNAISLKPETALDRKHLTLILSLVKPLRIECEGQFGGSIIIYDTNQKFDGQISKIIFHPDIFWSLLQYLLAKEEVRRP